MRLTTVIGNAHFQYLSHPYLSFATNSGLRSARFPMLIS